MSTLRSVCQLLKPARTVALIIHQNPDGDTIGSGVALREALTTAGWHAKIVCASDIAAPFRAIIGAVPIETDLPSDTDVYMLLDCADLTRTGFSRQLRQLIRRQKIVIALDHHDSGSLEKVIDHTVIAPKACATTELVFQLLNDLRLVITPSIATALLLGLYTDTGGFTHQNTTSRTLQLASRLIYSGADLGLITRTFGQPLSPNRQKLWGMIFSELAISPIGIVIAQVTDDHFNRTNTTTDDLAGLANNLALIEEANAALVLLETARGYRGWLRTRHSHVNVGRLARLLGGHGQRKAAGFTATNPLI